MKDRLQKKQCLQPSCTDEASANVLERHTREARELWKRHFKHEVESRSGNLKWYIDYSENGAQSRLSLEQRKEATAKKTEEIRLLYTQLQGQLFSLGETWKGMDVRNITLCVFKDRPLKEALELAESPFERVRKVDDAWFQGLSIWLLEEIYHPLVPMGDGWVPPHDWW